MLGSLAELQRLRCAVKKDRAQVCGRVQHVREGGSWFVLVQAGRGRRCHFEGSQQASFHARSKQLILTRWVENVTRWVQRF